MAELIGIYYEGKEQYGLCNAAARESTINISSTASLSRNLLHIRHPSQHNAAQWSALLLGLHMILRLRYSLVMIETLPSQLSH